MHDVPTGPKNPSSTVLTIEEEAVIVAFRRHTLLPLDDCLYALQPTIPNLTRSSLHRCLQRHGISRLPEVDSTSRRGRNSSPTRSVTSTSISPRCRPPRESSISSWLSIEPASSPMSNCTSDHQDDRSRIPTPSHRGGSLQNSHDPHRQRHPVQKPRTGPHRPWSTSSA